MYGEEVKEGEYYSVNSFEGRPEQFLFKTKWEPPVNALLTLSKRYPAAVFLLDYLCWESDFRGQVVMQDGKVIESIRRTGYRGPAYLWSDITHPDHYQHEDGETRINVGMLPGRSSSVCILTARLPRRNRAHGNSARHRSMVVESRAYRLCSRSTPMGSRTYNPRAVAISRWAKSAKMRQSRDSFASASFERATLPRNPR